MHRSQPVNLIPPDHLVNHRAETRRRLGQDPGRLVGAPSREGVLGANHGVVHGVDPRRRAPPLNVLVAQGHAQLLQRGRGEVRPAPPGARYQQVEQTDPLARSLAVAALVIFARVDKSRAIRAARRRTPRSLGAQGV